MPLRIGFLGANDRARAHCESLRALLPSESALQLAGFYDGNPQKSKTLAMRFGGTAFSSVNRLLASGAFDAIYLCLDSQKHGAPESAALSSGAALFIEPPLAAHIRTVSAISGAIKRSGALVCVGAPWRYSGALEHARKTTKSQKLPLWSTRFQAPKLENWNDAWPIFDLVRLLAGEPKRIWAQNDIAKTAFAAMVETRGGALCHIGASVGQTTHAQIQAANSNGDFAFEWAMQTASFTHKHREGTTRVGDANSLLDAQNRAFIEAISHGKRGELRGSWNEATKTQKMVLAAGRALGAGKSVEL